MRAIGTAKRVPMNTIERAGRMFSLALEGGTYKQDGSEPKNFVLGRKQEYTQASCLYLACRLDKTNHMLIDFADAIGVSRLLFSYCPDECPILICGRCCQVNVFILGRSYLRLVRCLGLTIPVIDPSIFISRFASLLEFGDETQRVATDATRLVARFNKDWITQGRRPAGICGACLLLAARMNHFRRSIAEIVQVVKIADVTLRKRLEDFKQTPSGKLTIDDFRNIWLEEENEPPAYYLARLPKKEEDDRKRAKGKGKMNEETKARRDKARKRAKVLAGKGRGEGNVRPDDEEQEDVDDEANDADEDDEDGDAADEDEKRRQRRLKLKEGDEALMLDPRLEALAEEATEEEISRALQEEAARRLDADLTEEERARVERAKAGLVGDTPSLSRPRPDLEEQKSILQQAAAAPALKSSQPGPSTLDHEDSSTMPRTSRLTRPIKEPTPTPPPPQGSEAGAAAAEEDALLGLDEAELDAFILTEEEAKIKERVWVEFNRDYLEKSLEKQLKLEADIKNGIVPKSSSRRSGSAVKRSNSAKPGATGSRGSAAAENAKMMMSRKKNFSRKLNYDVINSLFDDDVKKQPGKGEDKKRKRRSGRETEDESEGGRATTDGEGEAETEGEGELTEAESVPEWKRQMNTLMGNVEEEQYGDDYDEY